jgi:spore germination protein PF
MNIFLFSSVNYNIFIEKRVNPMPSLVGPIKINAVGDAAVVNFGDSFYLSPKSSGKTHSGSGAFNTGDFINTNSGISGTNTVDPDVNDQQKTANA